MRWSIPVYYAMIGLIVLISIAVALYAGIRKGELEGQVFTLSKEIERREANHDAEIGKLRAELAELDRLKHIPDVIERAKRTEREVAAKLVQAQEEAETIIRTAAKDAEKADREAAARLEQSQLRAFEIIQAASREANALKERTARECEIDASQTKGARRVAEWQANNILEVAQKQAKEIASQARKEAKEKTQKVEETLRIATSYAVEIRRGAEKRAEEIGGAAYEALKKSDFYEAAAQAMQNVVGNYGGTYLIPASHLLDELAEEYGFRQAGERLKVAREATRLMEKHGSAASCNYPEGWKRDYAINFVLSAFNGKVDSILARVKPVNEGKLVQEIKDTYALVNHNGEVFRNARIEEEYLNARLDELKWGVAVQRLKEKEREEQRAIREQIREEEKARKEYERAIKQAERDEQLLTKTLEKARQEYAAAADEDRAKYEARLQDISEKLREAEEKNQRALSMAQQTKCGHVYVISNVGSFGEDVYKIGLTRRLEPLDRVRELGDASVPFPFDVHAMIYSEDAPALETALHRRFVQSQVNKVNRRKEFFRLKLQDIRTATDEMKLEVRWTLTAEARAYRETLAMERQMQEDPEYQKRWAEEQSTFFQRTLFDEDIEQSMLDDEDSALAENSPLSTDLGAAIP
jgi:hypothetical protein